MNSLMWIEEAGMNRDLHAKFELHAGPSSKMKAMKRFI